MKILVTGATGMVGSEVLRQGILDPGINELIAIGRNDPPVTHPKITSITHKDFTRYGELRPVLEKVDALIWCLGVSQLQVSKDEYNIITYEYTMAAAKALIAAKPHAGFVFVSGEGSDPSGKAKTLFGRVKGKAEKDLMELPFEKLVIARPAGIQPIHKNPKAPFLYKMFYFTYPLWKLLAPSKVITSVELAKALLFLAKNKTEKVVYDNRELKNLGNDS